MNDIMIPAWVNGVLQPIEKLNAHLWGLKHKAVSIFIMSGDHMLIQQRAAHKYHTPTLWANACCTHPEWGENDADCALRRLDDELGITGLRCDFRGQVEYRADVGDGLIEHEVAAIFIAQADQNLKITPNPDEVMATRWVDYATLLAEIETTPDAFTPWLRIYLAEHADMIFGDMRASA